MEHVAPGAAGEIENEAVRPTAVLHYQFHPGAGLLFIPVRIQGQVLLPEPIPVPFRRSFALAHPAL